MAKFSPTEAVFAGFRFARERPAPLLIWSAFLLLVLAVASMAMFDIGGDSMTSLVIAAQGSNPDPTQLMKLMEAVAPASLFGGLLITVFGAVLVTAMLRVRLNPGPQVWGGLRLGGDELRLLGGTVLVLLVLCALEMAVGVAAELAASLGAPGALVLIPGLLLILAAQVRLSLVGVICQAEGRIDLVRSIRLTGKGFWRLLGAYVLLVAITLAALFLLAIMFGFLMGAAALASGGGVDQMALALQRDFSQLNPLLVLIYVASNMAQVWLGVVALAVFQCIGVDAYRAFLTEQP
jgi:hypothetical protein